MADKTEHLLAKLARADTRKLLQWSKDRLVWAQRRWAWHVSRWSLQFRARTGIAGRLPPGPLQASSIREATTDEGYYRALQQRHGSVFKLFWGSGDLKVCVIGYPKGRQLLKEHRQRLYPVTQNLHEIVPHNYLRGMMSETHHKYRRVFNAVFRDDLTDAREQDLRGIIRAWLTWLAIEPRDAQSAPENLYRALDETTLHIQLAFVLGVAPDMSVARRLGEWFRRMGPRGHVEDVADPQREAYAAISGILGDIMDAMRGGDSGYADSVLRRLVEGGPGIAIDATVIGNVIYMVERGRHDLRDLLRWIVKYLSDHPDVVDALRAAPGDEAAELARACVLETLRLDQAEVLIRKALEPFRFEGYDIPKGSWVTILLRESHRDPDNFEDPGRFCPHRFLGRQPTLDQYAPFGLGEHHCIASLFVTRICAAFVEELVQGYTWEVVSDGPRRFGHFHWEPSPMFAIGLQPIA